MGPRWSPSLTAGTWAQRWTGTDCALGATTSHTAVRKAFCAMLLYCVHHALAAAMSQGTLCRFAAYTLRHVQSTARCAGSTSSPRLNQGIGQTSSSLPAQLFLPFSSC
jgi:hypothetical protein